MKHLFTFLFLLPFCLVAQTAQEQYLDAEYDRLEKVEVIEKEIGLFIDANLPDYQLPSDVLKKLSADSRKEKLTKKEYNRLVQLTKSMYLRQKYFESNPDSVPYFIAATLPKLKQACTNGGFELGAAGWSFSQHIYAGPPGQEFSDNCDMNINTNLPLSASTLFNDTNADVSLVTSGLDPLLSASGVNLPRTFTGNRAIRLGQWNDGGGYDITTISRSFDVINQPSIDLNFALVLENPTNNHVLNDTQPFFEIKVFDENNQLFYQRCIVSDPNDCVFNSANNNQSLLYTNWNCVSVDVSQLMNQGARVEISVADCGQSGHFGYAYLDDICNGPGCNNSVFGSIDLDPQNLDCPTFPINVCGNFVAPLAGTTQEGTLISMTLDILGPNGEIVGAVTAPTTITNNTFCFQLEESNFDACLTNFDFTVTADFQMNCGVPFITTLIDNNANPGPDLSFENCVTTPTFPLEYTSAASKYNFIETDSEGNFIIGAFAANMPNFPGSSIYGYNPLVAKFSPEGCVLWYEYIATPSVIVDMKVDDFGDVHIIANKTTIGGINPPPFEDAGYVFKLDGDDGSSLKAFTTSREVLDFEVHSTTEFGGTLANAYVLFEYDSQEDLIIYNDLNQPILTETSPNNFIISFRQNTFQPVANIKEIDDLSDSEGYLDMTISNENNELYLVAMLPNGGIVDFGDGIVANAFNNEWMFNVQFNLAPFGTTATTVFAGVSWNINMEYGPVNAIYNSVNQTLIKSNSAVLMELNTNPFSVSSSHDVILPANSNGIDKLVYNPLDNSVLASMEGYGQIHKVDFSAAGAAPIILSNYHPTLSAHGDYPIAQSPTDGTIFAISPNYIGSPTGYAITRIDPDSGISYFTEGPDDKVFEEKLRLYPNPAINNFEITTASQEVPLNIGFIEIRDMQGTVRMKQSFTKTSKISMNASELNSGHYFISVFDHSNNPLTTLRLIKK